MTGPIALTVHPGNGTPPEGRRQRIAEWLTAHGISPKDVSADHPVLILNVPFHDPSVTADRDEPWVIQVISFVRYIRNEDDQVAAHPTTGRPMTVQCTTPLQVPFPADPTTADEGHPHGEEQEVEAVEEDQRTPQHQGRSQGDEQQAVRPAQAEEVQDRRSGACEERPGQSVAARITGAEEGRTQGRSAQVPQPEEEEVGDA